MIEVKTSLSNKLSGLSTGLWLVLAYNSGLICLFLFFLLIKTFLEFGNRNFVRKFSWWNIMVSDSSKGIGFVKRKNKNRK